jgi:hypothetical protein
MSSDLVTSLVELVEAYHSRWITVHGDHGLDCHWCAGLHERHAWALRAFEAEPDNGPELEAVV